MSDSKIICAYDDTVANKYDDDVTFMTPSDQQVADTRVFLHVKEITRKDLKNVMIRTVDTDVLILAISLYQSLGTDNLWVDFGSGKNRSIIQIHEVVLDPIKRKGLRFFFCFTGCDQVSFFAHVSKQTAWKVWQVFPQISEVFAKLSDEPTEERMRETLPIIERFVILLYHRTSNCDSVNVCRRELFCSGRAIDNLPPTPAALFQQMKRAAFYAGYAWRRLLNSLMRLPPFKVTQPLQNDKNCQKYDFPDFCLILIFNQRTTFCEILGVKILAEML